MNFMSAEISRILIIGMKARNNDRLNAIMYDNECYALSVV